MKDLMKMKKIIKKLKMTNYMLPSKDSVYKKKKKLILIIKFENNASRDCLYQCCKIFIFHLNCHLI